MNFRQCVPFRKFQNNTLMLHTLIIIWSIGPQKETVKFLGIAIPVIVMTVSKIDFDKSLIYI